MKIDINYLINHTIKYIDWRYEAEVSQIDYAEWNEKIDFFQKNGKQVYKKTVRELFQDDNTYYIEDDKRVKYASLYCIENGKYKIYTTNIYDRNKNVFERIDPKYVVIRYNEYFIEKYGMSYNRCFGTSKGIDTYFYIPSAITYCNDDDVLIDRILSHVYKGDIKSAYGWALSGILPDTKSKKEVKGIVDPTPDYPFVFYKNSHHHAVYNEYSTKAFNTKFYPQYSKTFKDPEEDEISICFRASEYSFKPFIDELYYNKEKSQGLLRENYKALITYITGLIRPAVLEKDGKTFKKGAEKKWGLYWQAAVVLGRIVNKMITAAKQLEAEGNIVLMIATDGIIWAGKPSDICTPGREIGHLNLEYSDVRFVYKAANNYMIEDKDGLYIYKHQGNLDKDYKTLEEYLEDKPEEVYIRYAPETKKYEEKKYSLRKLRDILHGKEEE